MTMKIGRLNIDAYTHQSGRAREIYLWTPAWTLHISFHHLMRSRVAGRSRHSSPAARLP